MAGPMAGKWWAVPEGLIGDIINALASPGLTRVHWHAVQSATKPNAQSQGPYPNQLVAQSAANKLNHGPNPLTITTDASNALSSAGGLSDVGNFFHRLTEKSTWTRAGEVALGGILIYAGVRALTHGSAVAGASARKSLATPVRKVGKTTVKVAVPEIRLASRIVAKRAAPKTTARVASHRAQVKRYGAKTPYSPPAKRPPTIRVSHIYHHKGP